jgi:hypothetical protein
VPPEPLVNDKGKQALNTNAEPRDRKFLRVCENGDAAKVSGGHGSNGGAYVKECSGFMTYQTGMLSLGNVDMDHGSYIYS